LKYQPVVRAGEDRKGNGAVDRMGGRRLSMLPDNKDINN
jgi:hypothetical protein